MAKSNQTTGDKETDEILAEMEADGIEVPDLTGGAAETEDNSDQTTTDPALEESEDETEEEEAGDTTEEDDSEAQSSDEDDDEDDSEEDDESEGEEGEDDDEATTTETGKGKRLTLVQKYRKERNLRKGLEATVAKLQNAKSDEAFDAEIQDFATKNKMNVEVAKGLIELVAKRAGLPEDVMADIQASRKDRRNREYWDDQHVKFDKDFKSNVVPALKAQGMKDDEIAQVRATLDAPAGTDAAKSPQWAWDKENKSKSLVQLALEIRGTTSKGSRTSSEGGSRRTRTTGEKDPETMSAEDWASMPDEEFDKMSDSLGKSSKSVVHRA